jgi:hemin uptake protein HemP
MTTTSAIEQTSVVWTSDEVLKGTIDVVITHNGEKYHLKKTKNDRLILTK